jgi:diguanylate cyclase (GGDEF)-like protein
MKSSHRNMTIFLLSLLCLLFLQTGFVFGQNARENSRKLNNRGTQLLQKGKLEEALKDFQAAIKADPTYDVPRASLAEWYINCYKKDEAIKEYIAAIRLNRNKPAYYLRLGDLYVEKENLPEALKFYQMGLQIDKNNPKFHWAIGSVLSKQGENEKAQENYINLIDVMDSNPQQKENPELLPFYWQANYELGVIEKAGQNWEKAIEHFKQVKDNTADEALKNKANEELGSLRFKTIGKILKNPTFIIGVVAVIVIGVVGFLVLNIIKKKGGRPKGKVSIKASDADTLPGLAIFTMENLLGLAEMKKGLVYFTRNEEEPLRLYTSIGIDPAVYEELPVAWENMPAWLIFTQSQPFLFDIQKNETQFSITFPTGKELLEEAGARIGIPFVFENEFQGIAFLCYPHITTKEKQRLKAVYVKNIEQIRRKAIDISKKAARIRNIEDSPDDDITPAYNRDYFLKKLPEEFNNCRENKKHLALIIFECEGVDAIGNRFGDEKKKHVLTTVVKYIQAKLGTSTLIFRYSGSRFAVILPDHNLIEAKEKTSQILETVSNLEFRDGLPRIVASAGLAVFPEHAGEGPSLERNAINSLEMALNAGGGRMMVGAEGGTVGSVSNVMRPQSTGPSYATPEPVERMPERYQEEQAPPRGIGKPVIPMGEIDNEPPVTSPSGKLRMSQPAKTPISIAPPPEESYHDEPKRQMIKFGGMQQPGADKADAPFTFRSAQKQPPTVGHNVPRFAHGGENEKPQNGFSFGAPETIEPKKTTRFGTPPNAMNKPTSLFNEPESEAVPQPEASRKTIRIPSNEAKGTSLFEDFCMTDEGNTEPQYHVTPKMVPPAKGTQPLNPAAAGGALTSFDDLWTGGQSNQDTQESSEKPILRELNKPHFIPPKREGGTSFLKPKENAPTSTQAKSLKPERTPKRVMAPKANLPQNETSILRRTSIIREPGTPTSKLSPVQKTVEDDSKPMDGLIRRSKSASQVPSLQVKPTLNPIERTEKTPSGFLGKNKPRAAAEEQSYPTTEAKVYPTQEMPFGAGVKTREIDIPSQLQKPSGTTALPKIVPKSFKDLKPQTEEVGRETIPMKPSAPPPSAEAVPVRNKQAIPANVLEPVTGFFYKSFFEQNLVKLMTRAKQAGRPLSLMFFKLDRHKELKTKYGQEKLDNLLKETATMIKNFLKEGSDFPARYSDEIFVIILTDTSHQIAFNLSEQIRFTVGNLSSGDIPSQITLSAGISTFPDKSATPKDIMKDAYNALVYAIKNGGNRSIIWDNKLQI